MFIAKFGNVNKVNKYFPSFKEKGQFFLTTQKLTTKKILNKNWQSSKLAGTHSKY